MQKAAPRLGRIIQQVAVMAQKIHAQRIGLQKLRRRFEGAQQIVDILALYETSIKLADPIYEAAPEQRRAKMRTAEFHLPGGTRRLTRDIIQSINHANAPKSEVQRRVIREQGHVRGNAPQTHHIIAV